MQPNEVPVVVVGAGPAGLAAAISLARLGVETMLVERRAELSSLPRATVVSLRSMELMRSWGVEDAIRAGGVDVEWHGWQSGTLATVADGFDVARRPARRASRPPCSARPRRPACPRTTSSRCSWSTCAPSGGTRVHLDTEVVGVEEPARRRRGRAARRPERRRPHRAAPATSSPRTARTAGSGRRSASPCADPTGSPTWSRRSSARRCGSLLGEHRYGIYSVDHPRGRRDLPARGPRRPLGLRDVGRPRRTSRATRRSGSRGAIRAGAGIADLDVSIERIGAFSFAAQLADRFRAGNVFLAGDAAHRVTPRGGTGMNTAIRGGHDLGWKLGWVLRGWAGPELLDTYEAERRPIAAHNVARSADPNGSTRETADELHVDLGGRIAHVWVRSEAGRVSTLDLLGPGLTLFTGPDSAPRRRRRGRRRAAGRRAPPGRRQRAGDRHPRSRRAARAPRRHARAAVDAGGDSRRLRGARGITQRPAAPRARDPTMHGDTNPSASAAPALPRVPLDA